MSDSDSDSSEEDNSHFLEAVDPDFKITSQNDEVVLQQATENVSSNRKQKNVDSYLDYCKIQLGITPEFQTHIGKKLQELMDSKLKIVKKASGSSSSASGTVVNDGIRLYSSSTRFSEAIEEQCNCNRSMKRQRPKIRRRNESSSDSEKEMKKCASVAVSVDWVLQKKGVFWETQDPEESKPIVKNNGVGETFTKQNSSKDDSKSPETAANNRNACLKKEHKDQVRSSGKLVINHLTAKVKKRKKRKTEA